MKYATKDGRNSANFKSYQFSKMEAVFLHDKKRFSDTV